MAELGEYHKRRILVTFQHVDRLLSQSLHVLTRTRSGLQPNHVQDLPPSKVLQTQTHIDLIRDQMSSFLRRFEIAVPERSKPSSWVIKTTLSSVEIALEDLTPSKMRGYGHMDSAASSELTQTIQEMRKLVNQLLKALE
jgi:hypothetical protein